MVPVIGRGDMDDVDHFVVENGPIVRMPSRLIADPVFDDPSCQIPPRGVRVTDRDEVAVFAEVRSRDPRAIDASRLLTPAAAGSASPDTEALVRRGEPACALSTVQFRRSAAIPTGSDDLKRVRRVSCGVDIVEFP